MPLNDAWNELQKLHGNWDISSTQPCLIISTFILSTKFGSVLRHDYDTVDTGIIWNVVEKELPNLKATFNALAIDHPLPKRKLTPGLIFFKMKQPAYLSPAIPSFYLPYLL